MALGADLLCVCSMCGSEFRILGTSSDDHRNTGSNQLANAFLSLLIGQEWPITHRSAIDNSSHAGRDQFATFCHECVEVRRTIGTAGRHQSGNLAPENRFVCKHRISLSVYQLVAGVSRLGINPKPAAGFVS